MKTSVLTMLAVAFLFVATAAAFGQGRLQDVISASYAAEANKDFSGAIKALKAVEQAESDNYVYHLRLGWLYYLAGMWNESVAQYRAAVDLAPEALEPLQGMLNHVAASGKMAEVAKVHELILRIDPNNYRSLQQSAWLAYQAKDYRKAARYYQRIVNLYPTDVEMALGLGYSLKLSGDKAGANMNFNLVLLLSPKNPRAIEGLK